MLTQRAKRKYMLKSAEFFPLNLDFFPLTLADRKKIFLNKISGGKIKYKRYTGSPLRYAGGKSLAVGLIVELLPDNIERLVSPFLGGGSVEVACVVELGLPVIAYDIFDILINYWKIQIEKPEELYKKLSILKPTKDEYNSVKSKLISHWKNKERLMSLDLAAYYYFNHNLSYGPGFLGWMSKIYENENRYKLMIEKVKNFKAQNFLVNTGDFHNVIESYKNDFLYCDPPYYLGGDSKMFRGIYPQRNFPVHHNNFDHKSLRDLLLKHEGGFILSYNDCSTIREWYKDCKIIDVSWQYTMGQGEIRIGLNRKKENRNHVKKSHEILIIKYE